VAELKTLSKADPQFLSYLLGTFSNTQRALPVKSLNVNSDSETVTFEIIPVKDINTAPFFFRWLKIFKIHNFVLVGLPIFFILMNCYLDGKSFDGHLALLSAAAAFCLHAAVNLRNDYLDHLSGLDRLQSSAETTHPIQRGWITAYQAKAISNFFIFLGLIFGAPSVIFFPELLFIVSILLLFGFIGIQSYRFGLKYRLWTELTAFLFLGPCLTVGFQMSIGGGFDLEAIFLGQITGWFAVYVLHLKNFTQIMTNHQAGFINTVNLLGFEKAKTLINWWWWILLLMINAYHFFYNTFWWTAAFALFSILLIILQLKATRNITSPVGSNFRAMLNSCYQLGLILFAFWAAEYLAIILVIEFGT
jgi:1,4-dihydroxy-2-naphthoate polyprenyltransferase